MLQPRLFGCAFDMRSFGGFVFFAFILSSALVSCQVITTELPYAQHGFRRVRSTATALSHFSDEINSGLNEDINNEESIEATRIKREGVSENRDLTVLLVNDQQRNDYNSRAGRYHNVKPLIGLLTSTARTFIQDGVTTEFATQILGTTLNNGRIYAQLLTKSSLVLYNKPSNEDAVAVKPTRVHSAFDGQWSVKQDLGYIDPDKFVLKNTDYLAPSSRMDIVYASKPAQESNFWNASPTAPEQDNQIAEEPTARRVQQNNEIPRFSQNEAFNYLDGPSVESEKKFDFVVKPAILENINALHRQSKAYEPVTEPIKIDSRIKEELNESNIVKVKPNYDLPTFTIKNEFSPIFYYIDNVESRSPPQPAGQQTKLPKKLFGQKSESRPKKTFTYAGFADFTTVVGDTVIIFTPNTDVSRPQSPDEVNVFPSAKQIDKLNTKITFLAADIPVATATYKAHEVNSASKANAPSGDKVLYNDEDSLKKVHYDIDNKPNGVSVQSNSGFDFNLDVIQPSEASVPITENTRLTDNLGVIPIQDSSKATDPLTLLKPSATIIEDPKESVITESNANEDLVTSEEEADNTAAEVTEKSEEENEEEEEEEITTLANESGMIPTESGHSEESYEDVETTTETKHDTEHEVICSSGVETKSIMTTAYKTLTYLTTYFIPLESKITTTSVKSNVVVESNVGFLTNVICKSDINIEPTSVVKVNVQSSVHSSLETPEVETEGSVSTPSTQPEIVTEVAPKTTPKQKDSSTTTEDKDDEVGTTVGNSSQEDEENTDENETTTSRQTTTTERVSTSQSHVEVSVSTEHSTTPTEKPTSEEEEEDSKENEIDLIYKTLYTTYTYFTTFFGDQSSSVASHKSIVTNVITSTINLAQLDPSLLGAFDEDEIAPTSVGIGRPTESFAINSIIDLVKNKDVLESVEGGEIYSSQTPTPSLGDDVASIKPDAVKTYFTTYTFFTTIYVGTDANVCSRSEVYTNYVGPDELIPTKSNPLGAEKTKAQFDFRNCKQVKREPPANPEDNSSMESSVSMEENEEKPSNENKDALPQPTPVEVDMLFSVESNPLDTDNSFTDTVTDVKSSSSRGERQYIENNNVLDDQISSESNIEEIMPSPTLLLQTSYTTFTYFTTMYIGKDSSKVKSRLETITNVVTETITPKKEAEEESNLPITYYTTFTYWTTLYKDKSTTITSREEIVSNVVTPVVQVAPTISPIDTTPIDVESVLPPKELEVELKPSLIENSPEQDDDKATFYTTYTYFTTFYAGNTSQIRSSLETVTNIVDNTKVLEDNQLGRKVPTGAVDKNLIQDNGEKPHISPTIVKEEIKPTKLPDISAASPTVLVGTYIDNLFAEIKPVDNNTPSSGTDKKILFSQVAVISGDSVIITDDNKTLSTESTTKGPETNGTATQGASIISPTPEVIESSVAEPDTTTEAHESEEEEEEDDGSSRKKSRLTFTTKKPSFTPVIIPFASRNRPTFSPKARVPSLGSATTITRADFTPTITATPTLKSVRPSGFGGNRKASSFGGSSSAGKRFTGRSSISNPSANIPSASRSGGFGGRASIQPTSRRTGFRSSSIRANSLDFASRSAIPRIRPTASSRLRGNRNSASISLPPPEQNESETSGTQQEETATEPLNEVTEAPVRTTSNPLLRFRRPPIARQPGTAVTPRVTTPSTRRTAVTSRGRLTTTTRRPTTRSTTNPLLSLRRQRPQNALFPRRNLFKQPEPEPEEEIKENEQEVEESEEILEGEEFEEDNDYESSNRKEQQVATPSTPAPRRNVVSIRPFSRRRVKRQVDYGNRKYTNFRRPGLKSAATKAPEPEPETEPPEPVTQKARPGNRFNSRLSSGSRTTTSAPQKSSQRQPFIVRGESRTTTTSAPAYRRSSKSRPSSRTTTLSSRPKAPKLVNSRSQSDRSRSPSRSSTSRSRTRTTTSRGSSRQRNSFENFSGERQNYKSIVDNGKITVTHQIPTEVTIPVVNGKITEYKNVLTAKPSIEVLLRNQVATTLGPLGNQQLVLASESTKLAENGATEVIKFYLHETPTTTVLFTPTTIRGRKTSYSHVLPSTVYNVEPVTQTIGPEINANVPLANLLLSQLLLGNQQPAINPLLALQGQGLLPQQPVVQTPVTEYKTRTTTYVTTVTDARETVLPITFKGKAILTTIVDPTTNVITATEYITDTIVSTPTALAPPPQFNSLLLPLLLQQQQQQQQAIANPLLQTPNHLLGLAGQPDLNLLQNNNLNNDIYSNSPKPNILQDLNSNEDFVDEVQDIEEDAPPPPPPSRTRNKPRVPKPAPPKLTSVVTMYVSGRYPGEFSTVLSTVVVDDTQTVRKREAVYFEDIEVLPSVLPSIGQLVSSQSDSDLENSIVSGTEKYLDDSTFKSQIETQSLESIVGSLSEHIRYDASPTYVVKLATATAIRDLNLSSVDDVS
ncbi:mucin-5AC [Leguminivora glycinivorella]|uniref:mucin-5AC n=1 Tax=Leguminivora glycinivorella TaxID=1035111 RepID=UPI00201048BF|nr:mucin-5AC [Leguminivora glycinivorella]